MGALLSGFTGLASAASGSDSAESTTTNTTGTNTTTSGLDIGDAAVKAIQDDLLSGSEGLAAIFAAEKATGLFNSSVAKEEAGDLSAKVIGEIAKLRAKSVTTEEVDSTTTEDTVNEVAGLFDDNPIANKLFNPGAIFKF